MKADAVWALLLGAAVALGSTLLAQWASLAYQIVATLRSALDQKSRTRGRRSESSRPKRSAKRHICRRVANIPSVIPDAICSPQVKGRVQPASASHLGAVGGLPARTAMVRVLDKGD